MPSWDDVKAARRTNAVLGAVTALALFVIVSRLTNIAGGVVAGLFLAVHPLSVYLSSLGVSDAPFTTMVALTTLASMALAAKPTWGRAALLGLLLGLGAATKLSPLFLALGLAGIGFVLVAEPLLRRIAPLRWLMDRVPGFGTQPGRRLGWMLLCQPVIATGAFVVSYPFLWPDPMGRTRALFAFRRYEMKNQARIWPDASVDSRLEAFRRTWTMLEDRFSATGDMLVTIGGTSSGRGFDVPLALCGLAILVVLAFRRGVTSPTFLALAVAGGQALLIVVGLRVDFDRYYLPIVFLFAIGTGILAGSLWDLVLRVSEAWSRKSVREERPAAAFGPAPASTQRSAD